MANIIDVVMKLTDQVTDPLRKIRQQMELTTQQNYKLGRDISQLGNNISSIGQAMMPAAVAVTAVGAAATKTFMDFDATVTAAGVKAGATTAEMNEMRSVAGRLGAEFPISANEAAEGMDRLAAGGFNATETIGAMPGIIKAAVASGEDLASTSDVVTSALSIWNLKQGDIAQNTEHVADVIQMAANVSKLGMQDFGLAMQFAGAPAAALGVSIEELGTAMAIMSNNGINASTIGTSLRATMSRLASPPKAAAAAMERLGLQVKDASGNFVGLENIVSQMRTAMEGLSDTEQVALTKAIAGEDAYSGLLALIKTSPEAYSELANSIQNSAGSSTEAYNIMQNTLKGSIDAMKGSVESFAIALGQTMSPYIREAADTIKYFANVLANLSPAGQKMLVFAGASIVGFTGTTLAVGKMISVGGSLIETYGKIGYIMKGGHVRNKLLEYSVNGVMKAYNGLPGAVSRGVGAVSSAGGAISSSVDLIKSKAAAIGSISWADVGTGITKGMTTAKETVAAGMGHVKNAVDNGMAFLINKTTSAGYALTNFSAKAAISSAASKASNGIKALAGSFMSAAKAGLAFAVSPIGIAMIAIAAAAYLIYKNWDQVGPFFIGLWERIKAAFGSAVQRLQPQIERLKEAFNLLKAKVGEMIAGAFSKLSAAFDKIQKAMNDNQGTIDMLVGAFSTVATIIGGIVVGNIIILANVLTSVITTAIGIVTSVISGFIQVLTGVIEFITGVFTGDWDKAWNGIKDIFGGIFNTIAGICSSVMDGITSAISGAIDSIKSLLGMANGASVTVNTSSGDVQANAVGGIYGKGAFLTTFAEKSPEAAIPIDGSARAVSLWRQTGEMLGVMPKMDNIHLDISQAPVDLSAGFRTLADGMSGGTVTNTQTVINNQLARESQQGAPAPANNSHKQEININVNMGNVTIRNDGGKDLKTMGRELAGEILFNIQKNAINANVGAVM